jgi:3-oxoacyl-[acyl-carrier-protein] synthase II
MQTRRVVVTGLGVVSPLGCDLGIFWQRLCSGYSGIRRITRFDASKMATQIAGEVAEFDIDKFIPKKEQRRMDPFCHYAVAAAQLAMTDSGIVMAGEDPNRVGCLVGSGIGGMAVLEDQHTVLTTRGPDRCSPFMIPMMIVNMASGLIAIAHGLKGPNFCVVSACASGAHSVGEGLRLIQRGECDVVVAGGTEAAVTPLGITGFCAMKAMSTRNDAPEKASRPFDANRDGFIMGEGAGILVLEDYEHAVKRGARIYCELAGYGATCDASHITAPAPGGEGAARAMVKAMADGGVTPDGVDYVNAHGTSTPLNDKNETAAIKTALGEHSKKVMVSSTKSMTGHMLGAAGGIESVICALALKNGVVPGTMNYETPDPECDLDYVPNQARQVKIRACLNNSLGFGGHNCSLLLKTV